MKLRLTFFFSALITLAVVHHIANFFTIYWRYLWFDIPMHFFGGVCVALGVAILPFLRIHLPKWTDTLFGYVLATLFIGFLWEAFEYYNGISVTVEELVPDTILDFIMDALGGVCGYYLVRQLDTLEKHVND